MIPLRLSARNVRTYADVDVTFTEGETAIVGPNGAGKSTLVDLIEIALFADGARDLAPLLRKGETELSLDLTFDHGDATYKVERFYQSAGRGKAGVMFMRYEGETDLALVHTSMWKPLALETAAATQAELERILGFTRQTFRASSFCRQGDGHLIPKDAAGKALLGEILGLDVWDGLLDEVRDDQRQLIHQAGRLEGHAQAAEALIAEREQRQGAFEEAGLLAGTATSEREAAQQVLDAFRLAVGEARALIETRGRAQAELAHAQSEVDRLTAIRDAGAHALDAKADIETRLLSLQGRAEKAPGLAIAIREGTMARHALRDAESDRDRYLREAEAADMKAGVQRARAGELEARPAGTDRCDRCQQVLGVEARVAAVASLRAEAEQAGMEVQLATAKANAIMLPKAVPSEEQLDALADQLTAAQDASRHAATLTEQLRVADECISRATSTAGQLATAERVLDANKIALSALPTPQLPEGNDGALAARVDYLRGQELAAAGAFDVARERLNAVWAAEKQLATLRGELDKSRTHARTLAVAEQACGRNGVPAYIIENRAVPQLEAQANDVLERWDAPYRVELRTQRELKGGGVAEALDVVCLVGGWEQPFESFSGGEKTRIALAVRIGMARLLARRRGANSRLLVVDEPEGLDAEGLSRLPALLESLRSEYEVILVVSHQPQLATAFPRVWQVSKQGGVSVVDGAAAGLVAA